MYGATITHKITNMGVHRFDITSMKSKVLPTWYEQIVYNLLNKVLKDSQSLHPSFGYYQRPN